MPKAGTRRRNLAIANADNVNGVIDNESLIVGPDVAQAQRPQARETTGSAGGSVSYPNDAPTPVDDAEEANDGPPPETNRPDSWAR